MPDEVAITLAGLPVDIALHHQEIKACFRHWLRQDGQKGIRVSASEDDIKAEFRRYPEGSHPGSAELTALVYRLSDKLLPYHRVFFHGLAMLFKGKAWIFTGPSGIGKTTQYRLCKRLHRTEVQLICGDKSVVEVASDGKVIVHPTPWNGKERLKSCQEPAPLGGIICLKQDSANSICLMPHLESILYLFRQMMFLPNCKDNIIMAGEVLTAMVKNVPVWFLANKGDEDSAELACRTILASCTDGQNRENGQAGLTVSTTSNKVQEDIDAIQDKS